MVSDGPVEAGERRTKRQYTWNMTQLDTKVYKSDHTSEDGGTYNATYIRPSEETKTRKRIEDVRDECLAPFFLENCMGEWTMMRLGEE